MNTSHIFLDKAPLNEEEAKAAKVAIISAPLDLTTSFQKGTAQGPEAILEASQAVELYDIVKKKDFSTVGVVTYPSPDFSELQSSEDCLKLIESQVQSALDKNQWPIIFGGEHTISLAPLRVFNKMYQDDLCVLQFDAHADLRESFEGSIYSHACVMKRVFDLKVPHVGVGIRNYCEEEAALIEKHNIPILHNHDVKKNNNIIDYSFIKKHLTKKNLYLTIDIDGFDPSECPGTGTPEPDGLKWHQALPILEKIFQDYNVVGMDINEVRPLPDDKRTEFFAAKLAYQCMGMKYF